MDKLANLGLPVLGNLGGVLGTGLVAFLLLISATFHVPRPFYI